MVKEEWVRLCVMEIRKKGNINGRKEKNDISITIY